MTGMVREVYVALEAANVDDTLALDAASAVGERDELATKQDLASLEARLRAEMYGIKADIFGWGAAALLAQAGAIVALVKLL